jgi:Protein of unknown function (DUF3179)
MLSIPFHLSYNAKKALVKGIVIGFVTLIAYLVTVIVTTPSLHPFPAIKAAFAMNSVIIFGMAIGIGLQFFISSYGKGLGYCKLDDSGRSINASRRVPTRSATGSSSATAISSFFSFFSLVPLGCCGSWLLILSFLPSIFGSSLSVALIQYSKPLSYIGLAIVFGFATLSAFKLQRELKQVEGTKKAFKILKNRNQGLVLQLFNNRKLALVIATSVIIVISVVIITMVNNVITNSINFSPSSLNINLLGKGNSFLTSSLIGQSNAQKLEEAHKHIVPLDQIVSGGPPPDGIPSIDNPKFITVQEAGKNFLSESDLVLGLNINGDIRAYPLSILVWHEIVNDKVGGVPVAVTYCPLCFTNQVFNSTIGSSQILQFGTSGKLYNSNLVMYDRGSKSLWSQALGQAIVGKYAGQKLQRIPFDIAYWKDWKQLYPNSKILSKDTGFIRPYGADPYGDYYTNDQLYFPVSNHDNRLEVKEKIVGLDNGDGIGKEQYKAYKLHKIETQKVINDDIGGKPVTLFSLHPAMVRVYDRMIIEGGKTLEFEYNSSNNKITDKQTGTEWNFDGDAVNGTLKGTHLTRKPFDEGFWFEWVAFHPHTALYPS